METLNLGLLLAAFVADIFLAGIVLGANSRGTSHRVFALFTVVLAVHALVNWGATFSPDVSVLHTLTLVIMPLTTAAFFQFVSTLLMRTQVNGWTSWTMYALALVASLLAVTGGVQSGTPITL